MDYSLLLGVHDVERHERERQEAARQPVDEEPPPLEEEEDSCGSGCAAGAGGPSSVPTPPDSPQIADRHRLSSDDCIDPHKDIYAIPSSDGELGEIAGPAGGGGERRGSAGGESGIKWWLVCGVLSL